LGAFVGGIASKWVSEWFLLLLFGVVTLVAGAVMFLPGPSAETEQTPTQDLAVPILSLGAISLSVGLVVGLLGAGNFLFVPLLIYVLKIPTRITIGSALVIHVLNGFAGFIGKLITGQVPFAMTIAVLLERLWAPLPARSVTVAFPRRSFVTRMPGLLPSLPCVYGRRFSPLEPLEFWLCLDCL
jgi:uncharacterized membrane protein YfcA